MLPMTPLVLSSGVLWPEKGVVLGGRQGDDGSQWAMTPQGGLTTSRAYVPDRVWIDALTEVIEAFNDLLGPIAVNMKRYPNKAAQRTPATGCRI
jgi:hypothetical protein